MRSDPPRRPQPSHRPVILGWEDTGVRRPDLARLYDAIYRHRAALLASHPDVPVRRLTRRPTHPQTTPPMSVGTLVTLWARWPAMSGRCPACGAPALGTGYQGMLANAHVFGVCLSSGAAACGAALRRWHGGGIGSLAESVRRHLAGTPHPLGVGWSFEYDREAPYADVVAALADVGEEPPVVSPPW